MAERTSVSFFKLLVHPLLVLVGAVALTTTFFLVLPLIQAITKPLRADLALTEVEAAALPPPPPIQESEPEEPEEEPEEEPPELMEEAPPLDLAQLELALNPGLGGGWMQGDFEVKLQTIVSAGSDNDALFSMADLDQKPRAIYQPSPLITSQVRRRAPGSAYILFVVGEDGRVEEAKVQKADDPVFERPALNAVKQWKFEPGKRNGKPVRFRMRVPITFPKG